LIRRIGARTSVVGIIGRPIEQSLSPAIHNAAFEAAGLDWVYLAFPVAEGASVADAVAGIRAMGLRGVNVTMPLKQEVLPYLDSVAEEARRIGAVNTILRDGSRLVGANTDGPGFLRFLERDAGFLPAGKRVLLLGAGGSARSLAVALADEGSRLLVSARREEQMGEVLSLAPGSQAIVWSDEEIARAVEEADLIVNATPVRDELPLSRAKFATQHLVVDLIYPPPPTPLVELARAGGASAHSGLGMLLHQAALSFELWTGVPAPMDVMSAAALAWLAEERAPGS
jgi:shikimate dehydrogenase